ncbi:MAG: TIGR01777 family oxidoreductase [Patulibacter sp.]
MHVTITGATGTIGSRLVSRLLERGDEVTVLSRDVHRAGQALPGAQAVVWDPQRDPAPASALAGRDAVVNLAGAPVFQRWTMDAKREITRSRITTTDHLVAGIGIVRAADRPAVLVSGSASGFYGDAGNRVLDEGAAPAHDFLGGVASGWEQAAREAGELGLRVITIRTGLVLAADGGALPQLARPIRFGAASWLGNGRQYVPWIHVDDHVGILLAAIDHASFRGPINASAPEPATNRELTKAVGKVLRRPVLFGAPAPLIRMALGERAALVLDSCRMIPGRADDLGYRFVHPQLDEALRDLLG